MASYIDDFSPLDFQPPLDLADRDYDEVFEAELESYLSGRTKELSDKHPASHSHELNMMVSKIKGLLSRMALSGVSPDRLREEAEKWLKSLEASSKSLSISHDAFRNSSNDLKQFLRQFDAKLTHSSPDFSQLMPPSDLEQPLTARQLMAQDAMWAHKRTNIEENMAAARVAAFAIHAFEEPMRWIGQGVQVAVENFCNSETGKPVCQTALKVGGQVASFVDQKTGITAVINRAQAAHERSKNRTMPNLLEALYLIPKEQTRQFVEDSRVVMGAIVTAAPAGGVAKFVLKAQVPVGRYRKFSREGKSRSIVEHFILPKYEDVYFHATSLDNAVGILQSKVIKRLDRGSFQGAFVSTRPEIFWGDVVFALNRKIERNNQVINSEYLQKHLFAGFDKAIPVNSDTLAYIAVESNIASKYPLEEISAFFSKIAGSEIPVVPLEPVIKLTEHRAIHGGIYVPEEWPQVMNLFTKEEF